MWQQPTPEGDKRRREHGENCGTAFSTTNKRTDPWVPKGPNDVQEGVVRVVTNDILFYFYSALLDRDGPPNFGEDLRDGPGKAICRCFL